MDEAYEFDYCTVFQHKIEDECPGSPCPVSARPLKKTKKSSHGDHTHPYYTTTTNANNKYS